MARDRQFKARDKKTQCMTRDGLVEVNQTTGEQERISLRGAEFQLRQGTPAQEAGSLQEQPRAGRSRQPAPRQTQAFMVDDASQRLDAPTTTTDSDALPGAPYADLSPGDSLPRQASDVPATGSPGYSSAPSAARPDSGAHPLHTGGGRLHPPDTTTPEHRQNGSGYYQRFQETPTPEPIPAESDASAQETVSGADTLPDRQPSAAPFAEHTAPIRPADDLPLTPKPAPNRAAQNAPAPSGSEAASLLPEQPGRLRFEAGTAPTAQRKQKQGGTTYARKFTRDADAASQPAAPDNAPRDVPQTGAPLSGETSASGSGSAPPSEKKPSRLRFGPEEAAPGEKPDKKTAKLQGKVQKTDAKLGKAQAALPTKKRLHSERIFDAEKGKAKRKIYFEQEVKSRREHLRGPLLTRPVKAGANTAASFAHRKIRQVEQENVEVEAAHKGELIAERAVRRAYRLHKAAPYRRVEKLSRASARQHVKLSYREALRDNPKLRGNMMSRFIQKQKIKRRYAKAARDAKRAAQAAKKAGTAAAEGTKVVAVLARQHPAAFGALALALLLVLVVMSTFGSCANMAGSALSAILSGSYVAEDRDIDNAELSYTEWETDLREQIDNAERDHPGYDEYRYHLDEIGHDPYELPAYLTAKYQDYTFAQVRGELQEIFEEQYTLEFVEEVEIRTYTDEDGDEHEYEWYILNVNLTAKPLGDILAPRMDADQTEVFDTLMISKGNRQYTISPLGFDWLPNITCHYGWRIHPISGAKDFHNAVDIGIPEGTSVLAGHDGRVVTASYDADGYGWYITLEGDKGLATRYAHCSSLLVSVGQEVKKGETIAKSGNTGNSTGPHLHFEVRMDGQTLNPLFFAVTSGKDGDPLS